MKGWLGERILGELIAEVQNDEGGRVLEPLRLQLPLQLQFQLQFQLQL